MKNKKHFFSLFVAVVLMATSVSTAYAVPYAPGETLDPACHPGDANCNVIIPSFTAGGDLAGTSTNQTVIGLQGNPVSSTTPASNQVLSWNGSAWAPANPANSSQWSNVSGGISYNSGNVTVGTTVLPNGVPLSIAAYNTSAHPVDPTGVLDSTAGIQAAINDAKARNRGTIYFPAGTYKITGYGLDFSHIYNLGVQLLGDGPQRSVLSVTGPIGLDFAGSNQITMRDIGVVGANAGVGILLGRYTDSSDNGKSLFENVRITGSFTTADIYSISSEDNVWFKLFADNTIAGKTFYTSATNDLGVTTPRGTLAASANVHTTIIGSLISECVADPATVAVQVHGETPAFIMRDTYISTQGKGVWRSTSGTSENANTFSVTGGGIENCIGSGASTQYWPIYFDGAGWDNINISGVSIYQTGLSNPNPTIYQADGGFIHSGVFLNNYMEGPGYSFYDLAESQVEGLWNITVRHYARANRLMGPVITIAGDSGFNEITNLTANTRSVTGDQSLTGKQTIGTTVIDPSAGITSPQVIVSGGVGVGQSVAPTVDKLHVSCAPQSSPATAGSISNACWGTGSGAYGLFSGVLGNGNSWLSSMRTDSATYYHLDLQPNGGNVHIGTDNDSGTEAKLQVAGAGIQIGGAVQPICDAAHRGMIQYTAAAANAKDTVAICAKDVSNIYAWRPIY